MAKNQPNPSDGRSITERLQEIVAAVPSLHAHRISSLTIDGIAITIDLAPVAAKGELPKPSAQVVSHIDPLRDPATYPGGIVPGFVLDAEEDV